LEKIATNAGSVASPSGLAQINAWVDSPIDNTARRYYGGDLLGNLWRFDIDDVVLPNGSEAFRLATFEKNGSPQSITSRPELSEIQIVTGKIPVVSIATGKYLGLSDNDDTNIQSVYTFKDTLTDSALGNLSGNSSMVLQTLSSMNNDTQRTTSQLPIDWTTKNGWVIDLAINGLPSGERVTLDIEQQLGILRVISIIPPRGDCNFGGQSWIYSFDYRTGRFLSTAQNQVAGKKITSTTLITGSRAIKWRDRTAAIVTDETGQIMKVEDPMPPAFGSGLKRVSWRELDDQ
jgi:type IV pilus assembly protein PilY1